MPPKIYRKRARALSEADPNEQRKPEGAKKNKRVSPGEKEEGERPTNERENHDRSNEQDAESSLLNYICIARPIFDRKAEKHHKSKASEDDGGDGENDDHEDCEDDDDDDWDDDDDDEDDENIYEQFNEELEGAGSVVGKPAKEHPEHIWVAMKEAYKQYGDLRRMATCTDPDNFNMYIYNDFHAHGLQELIGNSLLAFDKAHKSKGEDRVKQMWAVLFALVYWLLDEGTEEWVLSDDGPQVNYTSELIGYAFLTMLDALDHAQQLKADSEFKDLSLVMSMFLDWSRDLPNYEVDPGEWNVQVMAYARKANIDLNKSGLFGIERITSDIEASEEIEPLKASAKVGRWKWPTKLKEYKNSYGKLGGQRHDITKFSRAERIRHSYDHKDPLAHISLKDLKEGNVMMG